MDEVSSYVRLNLPLPRRQGRAKDCSTSSSNPMMKGPGAESEEKREPVSDIDTEVVDSLKVLDPRRPIREADITPPTIPAGTVENDPEPTSPVEDFCVAK